MQFSYLTSKSSKLMKKKFKQQRTELFNVCWEKTFRIMKIATFLLLVTILNAFGKETYAQNALLNLDMKDVPIQKVTNAIEDQSEFFFLYSSKMIDITQKVDIHAVDKNITDVLSELFANTEIKYAIKDRQILLVNKETYEDISAQQGKRITGKVTGETGDPIPGVSVLVLGTLTGALTDVDGNYSLSVPNNATTIIFSFIGMNKQEVAIGSQNVINIVLQELAIGLDEVVVVGYGIQKKVSLTGAVGTINEADLAKQSSDDAISRLQGQIAGVTITMNNTPGSVGTIRVRGYGSLGNNNPLFVIDGIPRTSMDNINPDDIESMSVLKDASSAAIYGSRAANGVVLITTKRGKEGRTKLSFTATNGFQYATTKPDLLNSTEIGDLLFQKWTNMGLTPGMPGWGDVQYGFGATPRIPDYIFPAGKMEGEVDESTYTPPNVLPYNAITKTNKGDNLYDLLWRQGAPTREYNLNLSGGNVGSTYSLSAAYSERKGLYNFKGDDYNGPTDNGFKRYSLRSNSDFKINKWLKISPSLSATYTVQSGNTGTGTGSGILSLNPLLPVYDIKGNFAGSKIPATGNGVNPVAQLVRANDNFTNRILVQGSTTAQIDFTKDLIFKSLIGFSLRSAYGETYGHSDPEFNQTLNTANMSAFQDNETQYNWVNTLNYMKTFNDVHNFNFLVGSEALDNKSNNLGGSRSTFAFENLDYMVLGAGEKDITNSGGRSGNRLFSYFGRINYDFNQKYLFEATIRRDASSRFVGKYRWGTFPAFSVGWRISEEPFMSDVKFINDLKIRGGWGENGNDNVGNFNAYGTFSARDNYSFYNITGASRSSIAAGFSPNRIGNANAKWETGVSKNIGLDVSLLESKIVASLDVYTRLTTDMLYNDTRPATWGMVTLPQINIGEMKNSGFDLVLSYNGGKRGSDFSYKVSATMSHFKNEVVRLNLNTNEIRYGTSTEAGNSTATQAGYPIESFYGYVFEGYFNTPEDIAAWPKYNPNAAGLDVYSQLGVMKFKDVSGPDGVPDGIITPLDRTWLGDGFPDLNYGLNLSVNYKNWDLSAFLSGVQGRKIIRNYERTIVFIRNDGNYLSKRLYESWTPERYENGSKITVPITINNDANMQLPNSWFISDGSYLRLKDIQIGYTLPAGILSRLKMDKFRVFGQISNLFTITKYEGMNPEVNDLGIDNLVYPTPRVFTFGINMVL